MIGRDGLSIIIRCGLPKNIVVDIFIDIQRIRYHVTGELLIRNTDIAFERGSLLVFDPGEYLVVDGQLPLVPLHGQAGDASFVESGELERVAVAFFERQACDFVVTVVDGERQVGNGRTALRRQRQNGDLDRVGFGNRRSRREVDRDARAVFSDVGNAGHGGPAGRKRADRVFETSGQVAARIGRRQGQRIQLYLVVLARQDEVEGVEQRIEIHMHLGDGFSVHGRTLERRWSGNHIGIRHIGCADTAGPRGFLC